ncbi:MAG: DUF411 domain-containing protein [Longimicrobiales bacterium]|nr:DUF411 domain-containing protein [Longimicrobiales bacterium]
MNPRGSALLILAAAGAGLLMLGSRRGAQSPDAAALDPAAAGSGALATAPLVGPPPAEGVIQVFKSPTCGCCGAWIDHLEEAGFRVEVVDTPNMLAVKGELGLPGELASCHTARIAGYLVEGHVPARDIQRMLLDRPDIRGLAVPGMPVGSPGMEVPGQAADPYDVVAFDARGQTSVYARH